jgi:hypothetical protein
VQFRVINILVGIMLSTTLVAQKDSALLQLRTMQAHFITEPIEIDGELNESVWKPLAKEYDFTQNFPNPGKPSRQKASVITLYDNSAIYIGAFMGDICKDSVSCTLSERDRNENADIFTASFDTYNDDQNAFSFAVTSAGVQLDIRISANNEDDAWNAVWFSAVKFGDDGWYIEMKIPFAALRFAEKNEQVWGVNFSRNIRRYREDSHWNYINPLISGEVNQYGNLIGLKNIKSPIRLSLTPYISGYYNRYDDVKNDIHEQQTSFNGGMDLKYGINEAFTLDMTLIPDFGQVQSDNQVLNTTPFEVRFNEFRQFFTEGTEIYNKSGLFYSRRIGGTPINYFKAYDEINDGETVTSNPQNSKLINATKITGRTRNGTGIGIFNAITKPTFATLTDSLGNSRNVETDPLSNYNVFVIDQNLKNNSYINFTNTNVMRSGGTYDANTTGINSQLNTKGNRFGLDLNGVLSQQYGLHKSDSVSLGYSWNMGAWKKYGNYTYGFYLGEESDTYDPNDLGFLYNNNSRVFGTEFEHRTYEPKGWFLRTWQNVNFYYEHLFNPNVFTSSNIQGSLGGVFRNWTASGVTFATSIVENYDYFEPRVTGRYYTLPRSFLVNCFYSTDYRKKFALDIRPEFIKFNYKDWREYSILVSPRFRFNDKLSTIITSTYNIQYGDQGSALTIDGSPTFINDTIIFAIRDRTNYENTISLKYIFTNTMALTLRIRHYWAKLKYQSFHTLTPEGNLEPNAYTGVSGDGTSLHNTSFNAFNVDLVYTWVFAPGSELRIVWKNSIYDFGQAVDLSYSDNFSNTIVAPQTNSLSIKLIYFLDAANLRRKR